MDETHKRNLADKTGTLRIEHKEIGKITTYFHDLCFCHRMLKYE